MPNEDVLFVLPDGSLDPLSNSILGKMRVTLSPECATSAFRLLDTFDSEIAARGAILTQSGEALELIMPEVGHLSQAANCKTDFVSDLEDGPVKAALCFVSPLRSLLPLGPGQRSLVTLMLVDDEGKTRARANLHLLQIENSGRAIVATVQRLRGYDKAGDKLLALFEGLGGAPLTAQTLYGRLLPDQPVYEAKPNVEVARDEAAFDVANTIISAHLPIARRNEAGIISDTDTEFLHDYRIALRKIRSVLSVFKGVYDDAQTQELKARFSALMAPTGRLRDLDVYLLERGGFYALLPPSLHGGLDLMFAMFAEERQAEHQTLSQHLQGKGYGKEMEKLLKLFAKRKNLVLGPEADRPAHDFASHLIWKRYRKICRIAEAIDADTPDEEVHELRIHCKKLRYLMEFFAAVFPKSACKTLIKALKGLQDTLGLFNDYTVQQASLQEFLPALDPRDHARNLELAQSVGALIAVLHQRQMEERAKVVASFAAFNSPATQKSFRDLFHGGKE